MMVRDPSTNLSSCKFARRRRGATAVEFAIVSVPLFLFFFGSLEFGRAMMAVHSLEEASRIGCRVCVVNGATVEDVEAEIDAIIRASGISNYTLEFDPVDFAELEQWEPITVTVTSNYDDISWLPVPQYLGGVNLSASCTLPKEYPQTD